MFIREAQIADAAAIAKVHVDSWRTTYAGILPEEFLARLSYEQRERQWRSSLSNRSEFIYVAYNAGGEITGCASGGSERSGDPIYRGELYTVYLLEQYQRKGTGRQLISWVAERLLQEGIASMLVWVLAENPSCRFYKTLGAKLLREENITIGGAEVVEVAYGWLDIHLLAGIHN
jgi:L-amino acid N-acyltransferase YncA